MSEENIYTFDLPEETAPEIISKISSLARDIRSDWSDPRAECRAIVGLCDKLAGLIVNTNVREG
jgi:hypothetical protein